jgi:hypothetical protein
MVGALSLLTSLEVRLHQRDPKGTALDIGDFLPDARDKEWESPITVNVVQAFLDDECIVQFDEDNSLTNDRAADSGDRLEMSRNSISVTCDSLVIWNTEKPKS